MSAASHDHHDRHHCLALAERMSDYLDEELPQELRDEVQLHVSDCSDCVRFVESLRRVKSLGRWLSPPELPAERLRELARRVAEQLDD